LAKLGIEAAEIWHESELAHTFGRDAQNGFAVGSERSADYEVTNHQPFSAAHNARGHWPEREHRERPVRYTAWFGALLTYRGLQGSPR
jgi:hypothetical protein